MITLLRVVTPMKYIVGRWAFFGSRTGCPGAHVCFSASPSFPCSARISLSATVYSRS